MPVGGLKRFGGLVWVDATTGVPFGFGVVTVAVNLVTMWVVPADAFAPGLGDPVNLLLTMTVYTAPLAIGAAAAHAGQIVRKQLTQLSSSTARGWLAPIRLASASSGLWALAAQLIAMAVLLIFRSTPGPSGRWVWLIGLLGVVLPVAASIVGSSLGARFVAPVVAPLLAVVTCGWIYALSSARGWWRVLSPIYPEVFYSSPVYEPNHLLLLGQTTAVLALGVGAGSALGRGVARRILAAVALGVAAAAVLLLVVAPSGATGYARTDHPACVNTVDTSLCVYPFYAPGIEEDLATIQELRRAMSPYVVAPRDYRQVGLSSDVVGVAYSGMFATDPQDRRARALDAMLPPPQCPADPAAADASTDLGRWALSRAGHPDPLAETPDYASWSDARTRTWVDGQLAILGRSC